MATFLQRLGRGAFRHRGRVLTAWLVVFAALTGGLLAFGGGVDDAFSLPGSESQQAKDVLGSKFPAAAGTTALIVFSAPAGSTITTPEYRSAIAASLAAAAKAPQVAGVVSPAETGEVSADKRTAIAEIEYQAHPADLASGTLDALDATVRPAKAAGLTVHIGGAAYQRDADLSSTAITLALLIGLAVGVDSALFLLSRHRAQLAAGLAPEESVGLANGTAGSAVVFVGLTVILALVGLSVAGIPSLTVLGLGAAGAVLVAVLVAVALVPALLGFAGARLVPKPGSRAARRRDPEVRTAGQRWATLVIRKPVVTVVAVVVALLVVAIPAKDLRLAMPDPGSAVKGSPQRVTYDVIGKAFGPGFNGPLLILVDLKRTQDDAARQQAMAYVIQDLSTLDDVAAVSTARYSKDAQYAVVRVLPTTAPADQKTADLVAVIRGQAPLLHTKQSVDIQVTGATAVAVDVSAKLSAALVPFAAIVVGLCLILLLVVFRSLVIPVNATVGFLLSVGASIGATAAVFEWGWLANLVGLARTGPVISFLPILLVAALFGLAMNHEVFLVSSIREEWLRSRRALPSVLTGAGHASRVVTAAALITFGVCATFVLAEDSIIKPIAFGLGFGVLVDAFLVRMTLVPAVLALVGEATWRLPSWLDRALPPVGIATVVGAGEAAVSAEAAVAADVEAPQAEVAGVKNEPDVGKAVSEAPEPAIDGERAGADQNVV